MILAMSSTLALSLACTGMWDWRRWNVYFEEAGRAVPISFYGKVVDSTGNPVRARVHLRVTTWNWAYILGASDATRINRVECETDASGNFDIRGQSGFALYVDDISATGHKFVRRRNEGAYYFHRAGNQDGIGKPFYPAATRREVFTVTAEQIRGSP